MALFGGMAQHS